MLLVVHTIAKVGNIVTNDFFNSPRVYEPSTITAGSTSSVDIILDVENAGEDAFQPSLSFVLPTNLLQLVNIFNQTRNGEVCIILCIKIPITY